MESIKFEHRSELINFLAEKFKMTSYLEIGVENTESNFDKINMPDKTGVDPAPVSPGIIQKTSDDFFSTNEKKFDIIFIDGLHEAHQVKRDFENSCKFLNKGGFIILHDSLPEEELYSLVPRQSDRWMGDVYKFVMCINNYGVYESVVLDFDCGCTVVFERGIHKNGFSDAKESMDTLIQNKSWDHYQLWKAAKAIPAESDLLMKNIKALGIKSKHKSLIEMQKEGRFQRPQIETNFLVDEDLKSGQGEKDQTLTLNHFNKRSDEIEAKIDILISLLKPKDRSLESIVEGNEKQLDLFSELRASSSTQVPEQKDHRLDQDINATTIRAAHEFYGMEGDLMIEGFIRDLKVNRELEHKKDSFM